MGALVAAVVSRAGRARGNHPLCSFAAVGPQATTLVRGQKPLDVYASLAELTRRDGAVVLMGVDLNRMTLLHLAEKRSGRTLFRRWANDPDLRPLTVESGGCSEGFFDLEPALAPLRREATVGRSRWQVFPASNALNVATHAIRRNPRITHCGRECERCDDAVAGGPIL
jgi:aminoglycoside 3-N-acetyltransferase